MCRNNSEDSSPATTLRSRVRIPGILSTLFSIYEQILYCICEKEENKQKGAEFGPYFCKKFRSIQSCLYQ